MYIYVLVCLLAIVVVLLLALVLIAYHPERANNKNKNHFIHGSQGVDIENGQKGYDAIHGYRGLDYGTVSVRQRSAVRALVFLEECQSRKQYRAEISNDVVIGRIVPGYSELNDISVSLSANVSRRHCRLFEHGGYIFIENMSQVTCTTLNGKKLEIPTVIKVGDLIGLGDVQLRVICMQSLIPR